MGECGSGSREMTGPITGLAECCELTLDEWTDGSGECGREGTGVELWSSSRVKKCGEGAEASGGSESSSSEAMD